MAEPTVASRIEQAVRVFIQACNDGDAGRIAACMRIAPTHALSSRNWCQSWTPLSTWGHSGNIGLRRGARACARSIAGWKPLPPQLRPVTRLRPRKDA
jgi:hypothetical protein